MTFEFRVTWDYRCPFARNAHDHLVDGIEAGADWAVGFVPFCLDQVHVEEDQCDIWDRPEESTGLLALQAGVVVRDQYPEQFLAVHRGLFDARHAEGLHLRDEAVIRDVLRAAGIDSDAVLGEIETGAPLETVRKEHEASVADHDVWGVPTFIAGERAVFIRLMHPAGGDSDQSRLAIERIIGLLVGWPDLNEFKHTSLSH